MQGKEEPSLDEYYIYSQMGCEKETARDKLGLEAQSDCEATEPSESEAEKM